MLARLGQIQYFLEENSSEIVSGKKKFEDVKLPETKDRQSLMSHMIVEYLKGLVDNNKANITLGLSLKMEKFQKLNGLIRNNYMIVSFKIQKNMLTV